MDGASGSDSLLNLLRRSPRLKSFQAQFWLDSYKDPSSSLSSPIHIHDNLTRLHLRLGYKFHAATLICLFQSTPRIRKLTFTAFNNRHYTVVDPN